MKLTMYRGDTAVFDLACKQSDGTPLDISSGTLCFTAKSSARQLDEDSSFQKDSDDNGITITDGPAGLATVVLSPEDTSELYAPARLVWDLQYVTTGDNVFTLLDGELVIKPDVTRSIT